MQNEILLEDFDLVWLEYGQEECIFISMFYSAVVALQRLGKLFIFGFSGSCKKRLSETENDADYKTLGKFKESAWKFVYYSTAEVLAIAITYNEPWLTDTKQFWVGPNQQRWPDQKTK
jgi:ceramide synthetase